MKKNFERQWKRSCRKVQRKGWRKRHAGTVAYAELCCSFMKIPGIQWFTLKLSSEDKE